jgi:protein-S-isoprenylcysteine O-methyltransferase Ste14
MMFRNDMAHAHMRTGEFIPLADIRLSLQGSLVLRGLDLHMRKGIIPSLSAEIVAGWLSNAGQMGDKKIGSSWRTPRFITGER